VSKRKRTKIAARIVRTTLFVLGCEASNRTTLYSTVMEKSYTTPSGRTYSSECFVPFGRLLRHQRRPPVLTFDQVSPLYLQSGMTTPSGPDDPPRIVGEASHQLAQGTAVTPPETQSRRLEAGLAVAYISS
jgi:hypothetical protein